MMVAKASTSSATTPITSPYPIKTIVVLVQENRSFDHMLGRFQSLKPKINGVMGFKSNWTSTTDPNYSHIFFTEGSEYVDQDPRHSIQDIFELGVRATVVNRYSNGQSNSNNAGISAKREKGRARACERAMKWFRPDSVPVYKELVANFGVCVDASVHATK